MRAVMLYSASLNILVLACIVKLKLIEFSYMKEIGISRPTEFAFSIPLARKEKCLLGNDQSYIRGQLYEAWIVYPADKS